MNWTEFGFFCKEKLRSEALDGKRTSRDAGFIKTRSSGSSRIRIASEIVGLTKFIKHIVEERYFYANSSLSNGVN